MHSKAKTVAEYLKSLPPERRKAVAAVRNVVRRNLPKGYQERMNWGMIAYEVPLARYPKTYNKQPLLYAALSSQKNHLALYTMNVYADKATEREFREGFKKAGKKLDMGKCCIRFKRTEELHLPTIGRLGAKTSVADYIRYYERSRKK